MRGEQKHICVEQLLSIFRLNDAGLQDYFGSPTWIRTRDLRINSPSLYRLSYQGIDKTGMILSLAIPVKD